MRKYFPAIDDKHYFKVHRLHYTKKQNSFGATTKTELQSEKHANFRGTCDYGAQHINERVLSHTAATDLNFTFHEGNFLVPLVRVQSAAVSMAFSSGSPTSCPSSKVTSE